MKTRIITGVVGIAVLFVFLFFYDTYVANVAIAALAVIGIWEAHHASGLTKEHLSVTLLCCLYGAAVILVPAGLRSVISIAGLYGMILLVFAYTLLHHSTFTIREASYEILLGAAIPVVFSTFISLRDHFGTEQGILYLFIVLGSAWWSDTGAYFAGTFWGKKKLCPEISPKKTVEGLIGGLVTAVLGNIGICALLAWVSRTGFHYMKTPLQINLVLVAAFSLVLALLGVLGDLSFSIIKRCYGIKDYGNLLPGHGGVLDRFDSVLFIAPAVYLIAIYAPIVH